MVLQAHVSKKQHMQRSSKPAAAPCVCPAGTKLTSACSRAHGVFPLCEGNIRENTQTAGQHVSAGWADTGPRERLTVTWAGKEQFLKKQHTQRSFQLASILSRQNCFVRNGHVDN